MQFELSGNLGNALSSLVGDNAVVSFFKKSGDASERVYQKTLTSTGVKTISIQSDVVAATTDFTPTTGLITCKYSKGDFFTVSDTLANKTYNIQVTQMDYNKGEGCLLQLNVGANAYIAFAGSHLFNTSSSSQYSAGKYVIAFINLNGANVQVLNFIKQPL